MASKFLRRFFVLILIPQLIAYPSLGSYSNISPAHSSAITFSLQERLSQEALQEVVLNFAAQILFLHRSPFVQCILKRFTAFQPVMTQPESTKLSLKLAPARPVLRQMTDLPRASSVFININWDIVGEEGGVTKIQDTVPTVKWASDRYDDVFLDTHLGRPSQEQIQLPDFDVETKVLPVATKFMEAAGVHATIIMLPKDLGAIEKRIEEARRDRRPGEKFVFLLPNKRIFAAESRYYSGQQPSPEVQDTFIANLLAALKNPELYINEALASHQTDATVRMATHFSPEKRAAGFAFAKDVNAVLDFEARSRGPGLVVWGGTKEDKIYKHMLGYVSSIDRSHPGDVMAIAGALSYPFLDYDGQPIGQSKRPKAKETPRILKAIPEIREKAKGRVQLMLPIDHVVRGQAESVTHIGDDQAAIDIGPRSLEAILAKIDGIMTDHRTQGHGWIVANGGLGRFEEDEGRQATRFLLEKLEDAAKAGVPVMLVGADMDKAVADVEKKDWNGRKLYSGILRTPAGGTVLGSLFGITSHEPVQALIKNTSFPGPEVNTEPHTISAGYTLGELSRFRRHLDDDESQRQFRHDHSTEVSLAEKAIREAQQDIRNNPAWRRTIEALSNGNLIYNGLIPEDLSYILWFLSDIESPYRYRVGDELVGLALDAILFLKELQETGKVRDTDGHVVASLVDPEGRPYRHLVAEYFVHEKLEAASGIVIPLNHDDIIELTTKALGYGTYLPPRRRNHSLPSGSRVFTRPGQTPLGQGLRQFIQWRFTQRISKLVGRRVRVSFYDASLTSVRSVEGRVAGFAPEENGLDYVRIVQDNVSVDLELNRIVRIQETPAFQLTTFGAFVSMKEVMERLDAGFPVILNESQGRSIARAWPETLGVILARLFFGRDREGRRIRSSDRLSPALVSEVLNGWAIPLSQELMLYGLQLQIEDVVFNPESPMAKPGFFTYPCILTHYYTADKDRRFREVAEHLLNAALSFSTLALIPGGDSQADQDRFPSGQKRKTSLEKPRAAHFSA